MWSSLCPKSVTAGNSESNILLETSQAPPPPPLPPSVGGSETAAERLHFRWSLVCSRRVAAATQEEEAEAEAAAL